MKYDHTKPDVLIISSIKEAMYYDYPSYYSKLGSQVVRIDLNIQRKHLSIQNFNDVGIKYASINCEIDDEIKAWELVNQYLSSQKFDLIISLDTTYNENAQRLHNFLKTGGTIYTQSSEACLYH